jgi:hypothetical protein
VNLLGQFWRYGSKVYDLPRRLRAVRDTRPFPVIATAPVSASLFLGAVLRMPSFLQLSKDSGRTGWRRLLGLSAPLDDDLLAYVCERYCLEDWRKLLVSTNQTLKRNRAFESAKIHGLLVVALDANEQFKSRCRCCEACCQRKVGVRGDDGQPVEVVEFYHRMVYAQIHGPKFSVILDLEPVRAGEDECAAALRLLARMRRLYGPRFFDAITVDAWYTNTPFVRSVRRLGWALISVLKQERFSAYQEATTLAEAQKPVRVDWQGRQVALREIRHLTLSEDGNEPIRVVLADESWVQTQRIAGKTVRTPRTTHWRWSATPELDPYPPVTIWRAGHQRWGIENHAFNELTQHYHLEHCPHHHPVAIMAWLLILLLAFNLFEVFMRLHGKLWRQGRTTLQELARALDQALEHTDELVPLWSG